MLEGVAVGWTVVCLGGFAMLWKGCRQRLSLMWELMQRGVGLLHCGQQQQVR